MFSKKLIGTLGAGIFAIGMAVGANPAQAAIHTVVNTADTGNGSLRDAINTTNQNPNQDQIWFAIPGAGPHVITLASDLPSITAPVAIRGYSEPNASPATANSAANPSVVIDAGNAVRGLHLSGDGIEVRGLVINDAQTDGMWVMGDENVVAGNYLGTNVGGNAAVPNGQNGVHVDGDDNHIGGPNPFDRNVMAGNVVGGLYVHSGRDNVIEGNYFGINETGTAGVGGAGIGVHVQSAHNTVKDNVASFGWVGIQLDSHGNTVRGNNVGTDVSGAQDVGNLTGISVRGGDTNQIGGALEGEGNLVSGNLFGILLTEDNGDPANENDVQGNLIGTNGAGTARLANTVAGVQISASDSNTIGGELDGTGNVISGNGDDGVSMTGGAAGNAVQGNWIGTDRSGLLDLGNGESGVDITDGAENRVGATSGQNLANVIAYNDSDGVTVSAGVGNAIVRNSFRDNGDLGIDLNADGTTANDGGADDADTGPNGLQNGPEINGVVGGQVDWELETEPNSTYRLEFFASDTCDPSGSGEGQTHVETLEVDTNANGEETRSTPVAVAVGQQVTMTATRLVGTNDVARSTSEFSPCEEAE